MKKILLVTKIGKNYGALLQAYALKTVLTSLNYDVQILYYKLKITQKTYSCLVVPKGFRSFVGFLRSLKNYQSTKESVAKCLAFRENNFSFTKPYKNYEEVKSDPPEADIYLVGSDQVWNPNLYYDKAYFLMFGKEKVLRASYAASIGVEKVSESIEKDFFDRLNNIQLKSVREQSAARYLSEHGINSAVHLDPTLLLKSDEYDKIAIDPQITKPYILLYFVTAKPEFKKIRQHLKKLYPEKTIVNIRSENPGSYPFGDVNIGNIGPDGFIGLFKNADAVVTSSFHGTVFSIIYHKYFLTFTPTHASKRISDLLDSVELSDNMTSSLEGLNKLFDERNFDAAEMFIAEKRKEALEYLDNLKTNCALQD